MLTSELLILFLRVSLFVRLWVEISSYKYDIRGSFRQPLREAVSWNNFTGCDSGNHRMSASSWGCELKYCVLDFFRRDFTSASSWGCELKYRQSDIIPHSQLVSLFVRLWVEIYISISLYVISRSASSWGCELKYLEYWWRICHKVVSLFVRLWVEI